MNWSGSHDEGWPSWAFSNHDAPRCISRWCPPGGDLDAFARLSNALLLSLRGNPIIYQGEELGLPQAEVGLEDLQDPEAIANWPRTLGRDGARTPMPWCPDEAFAGFSARKPWLPLGQGHVERSARVQEADPASVLGFTRRMLQLRAKSAALRVGDVSFPEVPAGLLAIRRRAGAEDVICLFNLEDGPRQLPAGLLAGYRQVLASGVDAPAGIMGVAGVWIGAR